MAPTQRSAKAFKFGLFAGKANGRMPLDRRKEVSHGLIGNDVAKVG